MYNKGMNETDEAKFKKNERFIKNLKRAGYATTVVSLGGLYFKNPPDKIWV